MNEKLSFQNMAEALSQRGNVQKKVAESFIRVFFDTIVESVKDGDEVVKIDGLGTFKMVAVDSRESVNVSNGERIVIPGYNKLTFTADESVIEMLCGRRDDNAKPDGAMRKSMGMSDELGHGMQARTLSDDASNADSYEDGACGREASVGAKGAKSADGFSTGNELGDRSISDEPGDRSTGDEQGYAESDAAKSSGDDEGLSINDLIEVEEPVRVERANDEFSGIDLLISTPESVDDVRRQLEQATAKVAEAIDVAKKASMEKSRLERLLERLEKNAEPENTSMDGNRQYGRDESESDNHIADADYRDETLARVFSEGHSPVQNDPQAESGDAYGKPKKKKSALWWMAGACVTLLLACIAYFVYKTFVSIESVETVSSMVETNEPSPMRKKGNAAGKTRNNETDSLAVNAPKEKVSDAGADNAKEGIAKNNDKKDSAVAHADAEEKKISRPSTYMVKKGETLTRISMRLYGTKDSVKAIMRVNTLVNPNNVPAGAVLKLP